jgi:hypothetical protein
VRPHELAADYLAGPARGDWENPFGFFADFLIHIPPPNAPVITVGRTAQWARLVDMLASEEHVAPCVCEGR